MDLIKWIGEQVATEAGIVALVFAVMALFASAIAILFMRLFLKERARVVELTDAQHEAQLAGIQLLTKLETTMSRLESMVTAMAMAKQ